MNYTVHREHPPFVAPYYLVRDFQGVVVCNCDEKHNAELICKLLNNHT